MVSRKISSMMDTLEEESPGEGLLSYLLEISSPGVERPLFTLQDYARFLGKKIHLFLKEEGSLEGVLQGTDMEENTISLIPEGEEEPRIFPFEHVEKGHLVFEFEVKQHAHKPQSGESKKKKKKKKKRKP
jgi:ribosome maturation factor RimP